MADRTTTRRAPQHLTQPMRSFWRSVITEYDLDQHHVRLLTLAALKRRLVWAAFRCSGARAGREGGSEGQASAC